MSRLCPVCRLTERSDWPHLHSVDGSRQIDYGHLELDPRVPSSSPWEHQRELAIGRMYANDTPHPLLTIGCFLAALAFGACAWLLLAALVVNLAAPSSAETTAPVDVSGMLSARLSGAPRVPGCDARQGTTVPAQLDARLRSGSTVGSGNVSCSSAGESGSSPDRPARGTPSPSPAVANVATSEGPSGPTTPMPAST